MDPFSLTNCNSKIKIFLSRFCLAIHVQMGVAHVGKVIMDAEKISYTPVISACTPGKHSIASRSGGGSGTFKQ